MHLETTSSHLKHTVEGCAPFSAWVAAMLSREMLAWLAWLSMLAWLKWLVVNVILVSLVEMSMLVWSSGSERNDREARKWPISYENVLKVRYARCCHDMT